MYQPSQSRSDTDVDVVLVEDDTAIQEMISQVLEDEHFRVEVSTLGWKAQRHIREACPRLVILDIEMPNVDGVQLFYLLRADPRTRDIPVIFLTANPQKVHKELPNYQEMRAVLMEKPFDIEKLLVTVSNTLSP